jgi:methylaspartate ammonia-lyase
LRIDDVIFAPGLGGFFYDDQAAIRSGAKSEGFRYLGAPQTAGFTTIREPAESLGVGLVLPDGLVAWGDMMSVQYSGAAGRDPLFRANGSEAACRATLVPRMIGCAITGFRSACDELLADPGIPIAVKYGVSQALLRAIAHDRRKTMAEVICAEYALPMPVRRVPLYAQSGDARSANIDKMVLKGVDIIPHGLINSR